MRRPTRVRSVMRAILLSACVASGLAFGQGATPAARPPEVWAIVVGVDDYANPAIPDGRTSVRNAQQVRRDPAGRLGRPAPGPPQRRRRRGARRIDGLRGQHQHPADPAEPGLGVPEMAPEGRSARRPGGLLFRRCVPLRDRHPGGPGRCPALPPAEGCRSGEARADRLVARRGRRRVRPEQAPGRLLAGHHARRPSAPDTREPAGPVGSRRDRSRLRPGVVAGCSLAVAAGAGPG